MSKVINYTVEQTEALKEDYLSGVSVETIANAMGKSVRSVVAKLSREGIYTPEAYVMQNKPWEYIYRCRCYCRSIG